MSEEYKRSTRERALRGFAKAKTREERKQIQANARRRKAEGNKQGKPRRKGWGQAPDGDQDAHFEKMAPRKDIGHDARAGSKGQAPELSFAPRDPSVATGRVTAVDRSRIHVLLEGEEQIADLRPEVAAGGVAVGDDVELDQRTDGSWVVAAVQERRTVLSRPDPGNPHRERVLAANVDVAVVVLSVRTPPLKPGLVDRFLIALERGGVRPIVAVNKSDLLRDDEERERVESILAPYREIGIPCLLVSAEREDGLERLNAELTGRTCVFVGHSGVGKSSLLNALDPDRERRVGAVRESDGKGRHTTTSSRLFPLPGGALAIDTPGVRLFGLWKLDRAGLLAAFPELAEHALECRFKDCTHRVEPSCAVRAAVEAGAIPRKRFETYLRILGDLDGQ